MSKAIREEWDMSYVRTIDLDQPRSEIIAMMNVIKGIDARSAHILLMCSGSDRIVAAILAGLTGGLFGLRFVEAVAKGPNTSWSRLVGYWDGALGDESKKSLLESVQNTLAEASFAEELEQQGAIVDMQYFTARNFIDIRLTTVTPLELVGAVKDSTGEVGPGRIRVEPESFMAVEVKAYGGSNSFRTHSKEIRTELSVGRSVLGRAAIAALSDFWSFTPSGKSSTHRLVSSEHADLLVAQASKSSLRRAAERVLVEGRKRYGRKSVSGP